MNKAVSKDLGDQLRDARVKQGLTVAQAAKVLGVHRMTLYNYENGLGLPKMRVLVAAATKWEYEFRVAGIKVVPEEMKVAGKKKPPPVQLELPYRRTRVYKRAVIRIRPRNGELVITAVARVVS